MRGGLVTFEANRVPHVAHGVEIPVSETILKAYRADHRPWIVGFSGGKDSTALLQIVYRSLVS